MATLNLSTSFGNIWPPNVLEGGVVQSRTATTLTYLSDLGFTIIVRGTGFTYDDDLFPSGGAVTRVIVKFGTQTAADFTGVSVELHKLAMSAFGFDRGSNGGYEGPNGWQLMRYILRGNDVVNGSAQDDDLTGGAGNDQINAGAGRDYINADAGNDTIDGGSDTDTMSYEESFWDFAAYRGVVVNTNTGTSIDSWGGVDQIISVERFRDSIFSDSFTGSAANEQFSLSRGNDTVIGGDGFDVLRFDYADRWGTTRGVNVNLTTGVVRDNWRGTDSISGIEGVYGGIHNDTITGSGGDDYLMGGNGVDIINGGAGFDTLAFWAAEDDPFGTGIIINMNIAGAAVQDDGFGNVENAVGIEAFEGTAFDDSFTGNNAANRFFGESGDDTQIGGGGDDTLYGSWGDDSLRGDSGNDLIEGGQGSDTLSGGTGDDDFIFSLGDLANAGVDHITDFGSTDELWINAQGHGGLVSGSLTASQIRSAAGAVATTTLEQRFVYNRSTGDLYFDEDGLGGVAGIKIATLDNKFVLTDAFIEIA